MLLAQFLAAEGKAAGGLLVTFHITLEMDADLFPLANSGAGDTERSTGWKVVTGGEVKQSRPAVQGNFYEMRGCGVLFLDDMCVLYLFNRDMLVGMNP